MKKLVLILSLFLVVLPINAQDPDPILVGEDWNLTTIIIDGTVFSASDYGTSPDMYFTDPDPGEYQFRIDSDYGIHCQFPVVSFNSSAREFVLPDFADACLAEPPCEMGSPCSTIHLIQYNFYLESDSEPFTYEILENGPDDYSLRVTRSNGDEAYYNGFPLSTESFLKEAVTIYPNPALDKLTLQSQELIMENMQIYSILGTRIMERNNLSQDNIIDISYLRAGMYLVRITFENGNAYTYQFIKE